jgi:VWFA-related protein
MPRTLFGLAIAAYVSAAWVSAQAPDFTLKVDVPYVSVDVTVQDSTGNTLKDLTSQVFTIYENGVRQEITHFLPVSAPYNIFLLFDRSGSTQDKWSLMQRAVAGFIASLRPHDQIAVATFESNIDVPLPWTNDRDKALLALPQLIRPNQSGGTEFYASVDETLRRHFKTVNGRRALVVLTDGRDTSLFKYVANRNRVLELKDDRPYQKLLRTAKTQNIPVYFIAFNTDKNLAPNTIGADEYRNLRAIYRNSPIADQYLEGVRVRMEEIADASGGRILYPQRIDDIVPLYRQIGSELGTAYTMGYISTNQKADGSFRRIEVRAKDTEWRVTQSRNGYYAK